jgi:hypothetical protein
MARLTGPPSPTGASLAATICTRSIPLRCVTALVKAPELRLQASDAATRVHALLHTSAAAQPSRPANRAVVSAPSGESQATVSLQAAAPTR